MGAQKAGQEAEREAGQAVEEAKIRLRQEARARRANLSSAHRAEAAKAAAVHFFAGVPHARGTVVAGYWGIRDEMDCRAILVGLLDSGHKVVLPVVTGADAPLDFRVWEAEAPLYEAGFGTLAPSDLAPRAAPDLVLTPLLGFDAAGTRLGYGGGYYDRTLAGLGKKPFLVGMAFSAQELNHIPRQDHDLPLDAVVTEHGVRFFGKPPA